MVFDAHAQLLETRSFRYRLALDRNQAVQRPAPAHDASAKLVVLVSDRLERFLVGVRDRNGRLRGSGGRQRHRNFALHAFVEGNVFLRADQ